MENKTLDFNKTLNDSFEIFKKTYLVAGFAFFILTIFIVMMTFVGLNYFVGFENLQEELKTFDPVKLSNKGTIIYIGCMLLFAILIAPFNAGLLKIMNDADEDQPLNIATLFYYVNSHHYLKIIGLAIIIGLSNIILGLGIQKYLPIDAIWASIISTTLTVIFSIITSLSLSYIIFEDSSVKDSIKKSIAFCSKNFFKILLLLILAFAIGYAGMIALCVGVFFTFPIYYATLYSIYKNSL